MCQSNSTRAWQIKVCDTCYCVVFVDQALANIQEHPYVARSIRMLKNAKDSTVKALTQTLNQMNALGYRAPAEGETSGTRPSGRKGESRREMAGPVSASSAGAAGL